MEQGLYYEFFIEKIIKNHKNSLQEILSVIRELNIFEKDILSRIISYLKMYTLYEITCENFGGLKYYILNLGECFFIFDESRHCSCNSKTINKNINKTLCIHYFIFRILFNINSFTKIQLDQENMTELEKIIKENL